MTREKITSRCRGIVSVRDTRVRLKGDQEIRKYRGTEVAGGIGVSEGVETIGWPRFRGCRYTAQKVREK